MELQRERSTNQSLQDDIKMLRDQLDQAENLRRQEKSNFETQLRQEKQNFENLLRQEKQNLENLLRTERESFEQQIAKLKQQNSKALNEKEQLQRDIQGASDMIMQVQEQCFESKQQSLDLLQTLKESEGEVEQLKAYIIDLKARIAVYIPTKGDKIDKKLAEYINNYPDRQKLKIMFMRESEGVYEFGSKRIHVRVERDKIQIKVGGGYLSIDEFIDQYTPAELEKLERRDPLKRFTDRVAVQKTLASHHGKEASPVRKPQSAASPKKRRSPKKSMNESYFSNH